MRDERRRERYGTRGVSSGRCWPGGQLEAIGNAVGDKDRKLLQTELQGKADWFAYPSTIKMEAVRSSETSVIYRDTQCHISKDSLAFFKQFMN
jgi:hypothetical protein